MHVQIRCPPRLQPKPGVGTTLCTLHDWLSQIKRNGWFETEQSLQHMMHLQGHFPVPCCVLKATAAHAKDQTDNELHRYYKTASVL